MWGNFYLPTFANCHVVYSNVIMYCVNYLQQWFLNKWLLSQNSIPINIANIAQTLGIVCPQPFGMVCCLLESCRTKSTFIVNKRIFVCKMGKFSYYTWCLYNRSYRIMDKCFTYDTRSRLHGQCVIMPVPNFDWSEFEERAHPLFGARSHSSTSITKGKIIIAVQSV